MTIGCSWRLARSAGPVVGACLALGCGARPQDGAPALAPSAARDAPAPDPRDPEYLALRRLLDEPWGTRHDRFDTLDVPLADAARWLRLRFGGYPARAAFRYDRRQLAIALVAYEPSEAGEASSETPQRCLERFVARSLRAARSYDVVVGGLRWGATGGPMPDGSGAPTSAPAPGPLPVATADAHFATLFRDDAYVAAAAAYPSWPGTCLVHALAVKAAEHAALAREVVARWVRQGAPRLAWRAGLAAAPALANP